MKYVFDNPDAYRGFFISKFAELELAMSRFLQLYFLPNDQTDEMIHIIIDRLTFEAKRTAYKALLDKLSVSQDRFIKTKNNKYPYSKLIEEIRQLNDLRIQFAHYILSDTFMDRGYVISLLEFRNAPKFWAYSQEDFDKMIDKIIKTHEDVTDTFKYLKLSS